jgi:hypothetical protein
MLYRFVKKDGNVVRIGAEDAEALETKLQGYLDNGYEHARAEEHDAQVIGGAAKTGEEAQEEEASEEAGSETATADGASEAASSGEESSENKAE